MKKLAFFLLLAAMTVSAQTQKKTDPPPSATDKPFLLPGHVEIEAALQRTFGYDPGVSWQIIDVRPSAISGVADVVLSINKQPAQHIYLSADTQNAIVGEMVPFGTNPFAPARAKLEPADGPARGPEKPSITIVEFSDLECPHCKAAQPIMEKLITDFPQIRFIFQQFPLPASLHPWAMKAALYADCAGKTSGEGFWKYINSIFENQGSIAQATADDKLKELATAAGYDAAKISACAAAPESDARVKKSLDLGQSLEVNSTPTVFVNGRRIQGIATIPYEQLKMLVQFEVDHAGK
jgi:protein-disulfide isomerase